MYSNPRRHGHACTARNLGLSLFVIALLGACGGRDTKGPQSSSGEDQAGTSSATAGGGGNAGRGSGGTGGLAQGSPCLEPVAPTDASSCAFEGYAFDVEAEHCRYFAKASCGATKNRFDTLEACVATCDPGGLERCQIAADCTVQNAACCGGCEPIEREDLRAINRAYAEVETCVGLQCAPCPSYEGAPEGPYYGATCTNQRCELIDVRDSELGSCESDGDCRLRRGLECCECGSAGPWVAVGNQPLAVANLLCGAPLSCDRTCDLTPPGSLRAICADGRCLTASVMP